MRKTKKIDLVPKEDFTDDEIKLIRQYCDERILEINRSPLKNVWYVNEKQKIKIQVLNISQMNVLLWEDMYDMVWNREYLDHRHNKLNKSILRKMESSEYYIKKVKDYEKSLKRDKARIKKNKEK